MFARFPGHSQNTSVSWIFCWNTHADALRGTPQSPEAFRTGCMSSSTIDDRLCTVFLIIKSIIACHYNTSSLISLGTDFLLRHMFPALHTLWLLLVVVALNILGTVVVLVQARKSNSLRRPAGSRCGPSPVRFHVAGSAM